MTRSALLTGVSRRVGIAWTVAEHLQQQGWTLSTSGWPAHDQEQPWGGDESPPDNPSWNWRPADLADPAVPDRLVAEHVAVHGGIDALVAVHARSSAAGLGELTAAELDLTFAINTRATLLLVQAAAAAGVRRVVLFTTGVHRDPMPTEIPYATSKAALQGMTSTLAAALARQGTTVNCINPGPVDTGYADESAAAHIAARMPARRWGLPGDIAPIVAWLLSDEAHWVTGQTLDADGGWTLRSGVEPAP
ncbi:MAG: SDR family oxidoreductase [Geodermatophilaceae bacterium]